MNEGVPEGKRKDEEDGHRCRHVCRPGTSFCASLLASRPLLQTFWAVLKVSLRVLLAVQAFLLGVQAVLLALRVVLQTAYWPVE